jgi:hypothetical protein
MDRQTTHVDSTSVGDAGRYLPLAQLEMALEDLPSSPTSTGRVALIVRRGAGGHRDTPGRIPLARETGVPGDAWGRLAEPKSEMQIAVMQRDVAELIANGQPLTLFGDNLFLDLDVSAANLPPGSRVRVGTATLEVTPKPHNGCRKFRSRFGDDALRFVSSPEHRHRNLRGVYMCVVEDGEVASGDVVQVVSRAPAARDEEQRPLPSRPA